MSNNIQQKLHELESLDTKALMELWPTYFVQKPKRVRRDYLAASIAYKIQEKAYGGLPATIRNKLQRLAFEGQQTSQPKYKLLPGTQLVRDWNGKRYHVLVTQSGFEYEGCHYRSLTKIATKIAGAKWSGPLFFGLRKQGGKHAKTT